MGTPNQVLPQVGSSEILALANELQDLAEAQTIGPLDDDSLIAIPKANGGRELIDPREKTDKYLPKPRRKIGCSHHDTCGSFVDIVKRFAGPESVIYADKSNVRLTATFNYHHGAAGDPGHGDHKAVYACPLSDEWQEWQRVDGEFLDQQKFAEFIEDRLMDVSSPEKATDRSKELQALLGNIGIATPNKLLELSRGLAVSVGQSVKNFRNTATGECVMEFVEAHSDEAGAPLKVPGMFLITIPIFDGGAYYQLAVRLRYRLASGKVLWSFQLQQPKVMLDHAFSEVVETVEEGTSVPVFFGRAE